MRPDAPLLHDDLFTAGVEPKPDKPSNVAKRVEITLGDIDAGFKKADVIVEREFKTAPVHQGYNEPHAAVGDRKSTRLNSSHSQISYAVFCLKKKKHDAHHRQPRHPRCAQS